MKYTALCIQWQVNSCGDVPLVEIDGLSYAAAPTQVLKVLTPPVPTAKSRRRPAEALLGSCVAKHS